MKAIIKTLKNGTIQCDFENLRVYSNEYKGQKSIECMQYNVSNDTFTQCSESDSRFKPLIIAILNYKNGY